MKKFHIVLVAPEIPQNTGTIGRLCVSTETALHLGKPILTLPLKAMVEQRFNALYVERLNYGMRADMLSLEPELLRRFEARLPEFKAAIAAGNFCGNELVFGLVDHFIRHGNLPLQGAPAVLEG